MARTTSLLAWLRRFGRTAFRHRLLVGMALPLGLAMLAFVALSVLQQRRQLLQQQEHQGRTLAQTLAVSNRAEVLRADTQALKESLHSVASYPQLRYAMVLSPEGRILAHTDPAQVGRTAADDITLRLLKGPAEPITLFQSDQVVEVAAPILDQGRLSGWVGLGLGTDAAIAGFRTALRDGLLFTLLALGLGGLVAYLASRRLIRRLDQLVALTQGTAPGSAPRSDELSTISHTFDRLTQELALSVSEVRTREQFLHTLMEHLPVAVTVLGGDGTIRFGNPAAHALFDLPLEQLVGESYLNLVGALFKEDGRPLPEEEEPIGIVQRERRAYRNGVIGFRKQTGAPIRWLHLDVFPDFDADGKVRQFFVAMVDITKRHEAKQELEKALIELEDLYQNAPFGYHSLGPDGTFLRINDTELRWLGYDRKELVGRRTFLDLLAPHSRQVFLESAPVLEQRGWVKDLELDLMRKNGSLLSTLLTATIIQGPGGAFLHTRASLADISQRVRAERALRASQFKLAQAQRIAHVGNWEYDLVQNILTWSEEVYRIFELDPGTFRGSFEAFMAVVHPEDREVVAWAFRDSVRTREPYEISHRLKLAGGRIKFVLEHCEVHCDPLGQPIRTVGTVQDITERMTAELEHQRLETEVQHFQRLDSLGNLASGVAHDMNNILAVVLNLAELNLEQLPESDPTAHSFRLIQTAATRGAGVVRRLTQFARKQLESAEPLDLNALVREEAELLERTTLKKAQWLLDLEDPLPKVMGQVSEIGNAIINLCVNSLDALPRGGRITLRTRRLPDDGVVVSVQDDGTGMPPEVLAKALDPYFTTKPVGKGTGLGLATVYGTMKAHGGTVEIQSEVGVGTTVHLRFPAANASLAPPSEAGGSALVLPPIRVLLVDDDELIRLTVPPLLHGLGLKVEVAANGLQALEKLEAPDPIDLVILDQNMPMLSGTETLARLRATRPGLPVLFATGYRDAELAALPASYPRLVTLEKPYTIEELRRAIADLLADTQPGQDFGT